MLQGFYDKDKERFLETLKTATRDRRDPDITLDVMRTLPEALRRDESVLLRVQGA